ncbi:MFS transporter [Actinophytocola oryzae]|uniref:Sugar phosphate permease n=1 Tax=Actinophytocola oryzae TaxID=502181 RepID=A0A4R7VBF5_9PSEU|nr:MFS transporter [Actinophytocola oryzae]TDV46382.1 sugar phosphate permease [Actinophytocola oryzae]
MIIWVTAVVVYLAAVFHRTSLGVASLQAGERFHLGPAALGTFTVLQIGVYASMQVPTGLLVDRYGARRVLTVAALLMGLGQVLFAFATSYPLGLLARAVLGVGDAMTFVSVLRLVAAHFPARRYAAVASFTAALGALGNLASTVPLSLLLDSAGWTTTFAVTGSVTALYSVVLILRVRDNPIGAVPEPVDRTESLRSVLTQVSHAWRTPGTRLGFWVHFSTMFAPAMLGLLWGFPYLVQAQGLTEPAAGLLLSLLVLGAIGGGPVVGTMISRRPEWRTPMVVGYVVAALGVWALLLGWPGGHVPLWLLVAGFAFLSLGGPASTIGFALARDYNPMRRVSTATGVVNVGGFVAITVSALAVGLLLDAAQPLGPATAFRVAFLSVVAVLVLGLWRTSVWWRRARAAVFEAASRGEDVPVRIRRRSWDLAAAA